MVFRSLVALVVALVVAQLGAAQGCFGGASNSYSSAPQFGNGYAQYQGYAFGNGTPGGYIFLRNGGAAYQTVPAFYTPQVYQQAPSWSPTWSAPPTWWAPYGNGHHPRGLHFNAGFNLQRGYCPPGY